MSAIRSWVIVLTAALLGIAGNAYSQTTITSGTDTFVMGSQPGNAFGTAALWEFDGSDAGSQNHGLLRFDIPSATFLDFLNTPDRIARMQLYTENVGNTGRMYRMWTPWDNSTTWNSLGGGVQPGTNAEASYNATTAGGASVGLSTTNVTTDVEAWAGGPANRGWGFISTGTDGQEIRSFETAAGNPPQLVLGRLIQTGQSATATTTVINRVPPTDMFTPFQRGKSYRYLAGLGGSTNYPVDGQGDPWNSRNFDDAAWTSGTAILSFGVLSGSADTGGASAPISSTLNATGIYNHPVGKTTDLFRTTFSVSNAGLYSGLSITALVEDGAVFYLNGTEVGRINMPVGPVTVDTTAAADMPDGASESTYRSLMVDLGYYFPGLLVDGTNYLAAELHQSSPSSNDGGFDLRLDLLQGFRAEIIGDLVPVPEPGSMALLLAGALAAAIGCAVRRARPAVPPARTLA